MSKPLCVIRGPVATRSGYGDMTRDIARHMIEYGKYDVKIISTRWGACPMNSLDDSIPKDKVLLDAILTTPLTKQPEVFISVTIPSEFQKVGKYNIGITAGIETTLPDASWIQGCNRMDTVWFTSEFSKTTFENAEYKIMEGQIEAGVLKLEVPVEVLHNCVDTKIFKKLYDSEIDKRIQEEMKNIPETFNYLFVGHWLQGDMSHDRKNVSLLIKIFLEVFKKAKGDRPGLILKTSGAQFSVLDKEDMLRKIEMIKNSVVLEAGETLPNVYLIYGELTEPQMNSLYNHPKVKVHISITKGEGFGRPLLEASLTGKPMIVSGWSGQLDFLEPTTTLLIGGTLEKVHHSAFVDKVILKEASWFAPEVNDVANAMYDTFLNYSKHKKLCAPVANRNKNAFNYEAIKKKMHKLLDKYLPAVQIFEPIKLPELQAIKLPIKMEAP